MGIILLPFCQIPVRIFLFRLKWCSKNKRCQNVTAGFKVERENVTLALSDLGILSASERSSLDLRTSSQSLFFRCSPLWLFPDHLSFLMMCVAYPPSSCPAHEHERHLLLIAWNTIVSYSLSLIFLFI